MLITTGSKRVKNKPYLLWSGLNILKQTKKTNQLQNCNKSNKWNVKKIFFILRSTETLHTVCTFSKNILNCSLFCESQLSIFFGNYVFLFKLSNSFHIILLAL